MINLEGIKSLIKAECVDCNIYERIGMGNRCEDCPWAKGSRPKGRNKSNITPAAKYFHKYGLKVLKKNRTYIFGKCHIFMYLYHSKLNFKPPPLPTHDRFGNEIDQNRVKWELHHLDGDPLNDRKENLFWVLSTEHPILEAKNNRKKKRRKVTNLKELGIR